MTAQTATAVATQPVKIPAISKQSGPDKNIERFDQIYDSIATRAFEIFNDNGRWFGNELSDWLQAESEILHPIHLEIAETEDALNVRAEVPGFTSRELNIQVDGNRLTIAGRHESKEETTKGRTIYSERCAKEILRSVELPMAVDATKVNAQLMNGILSIELPKAQEAKAVPTEMNAAN
ncbi:MAG TPA: Hsp20 family protein [Candidatus Acidoferrales bacterium]|jgi:HSP20 family molecular chaperone IbpA|nr:Hsp20 family protein [Candidatus Acidoferrales bacterium]